MTHSNCFFIISFVVVVSSFYFATCQLKDYTADINDVKCLVCTRVIEEMQKNISKIDKRKTINVGGFRLDDDGNTKNKYVPYVRSELFLHELMENICEKMEDYVQATFKDSGKFTVLPLMLDDGTMNPQVSEVDMVKDNDLNKNLKTYCEIIIEEHDEDFIKVFKSDEDIVAFNVCKNTGTLCTDIVHEEL